MTNILKSKIFVPPGIDLTYEGCRLNLKTNTESINIDFPAKTKFVYDKRYLGVYPIHRRHQSALYGCLIRKLKVLVKGLLIAHIVQINIVGWGYTAKIKENQLIIQLGHSHDIVLNIPSSVEILILNKKADQLKLTSYSLEDLHQISSRILHFRKPNPYTSRGVIWIGKTFRTKEFKRKPY